MSSLALTYLDRTQSNFIDEKLAIPTPADSQILRGVADSGDGSPVIAVTSVANATQHVTIQCIGSNGPVFSKTITLAPAQSILTEACSSRASSAADLELAPQASQISPSHATGIALTSDGAPGSFAAFGLAPHQKSGVKYFSSVFFTDPMSLLSPNSVIPAVPVGPTTALGGGNYVPELSLANFSAKAAHVTVQYAVTSGDAPNAYQVQNLTVPPGQTREVVLDNLQGDPDLKNSFTVISDGAPGDILAKLVSETDSRTGEVELLAKDQLDQNNVGTQPWSTQDGTQSTLLLFDDSAGPQTFQVHFSGGGVAWHKNYKLQSMETEAINIGDLIANKTPDDSGKILPLDTTSGVAIWIMAHHGAGKGRVLQSNATTGMARSFSCGNYATVAGAEWQSNVTLLPVGRTANVGSVVAAIDLVTGGGGGCTGTFEDYGNGNGYEFTYSSSNSSIANVTDPTGTNPDAEVEGVSGGSATIFGTVQDPDHNYCEGSAQGSVFVQIPTSLSIVAGTDSTTPQASCTFVVKKQNVTGCGVTRSFTYQVLDQKGNPIKAAGLYVWDAFGTPSPNPLALSSFVTTCLPPNTGPCGFGTDANGQFHEADLSLCSTACYNSTSKICKTGGPSVVTQTIHIANWFINQTISYYCDHILVNGK